MPKFSTDQFIRGQVLAAYRSLDDPHFEEKPVEGSVLRRTQALVHNVETPRKQQLQQEILTYFHIGQLWRDETDYILDVRERQTILRSLSQTIPRRDAIAANRIYQLFQYKPDTVIHLQGVTKRQIAEIKGGAFEELVDEVKQYQRDYQELELFLDV